MSEHSPSAVTKPNMFDVLRANVWGDPLRVPRPTELLSGTEGNIALLAYMRRFGQTNYSFKSREPSKHAAFVGSVLDEQSLLFISTYRGLSTRDVADRHINLANNNLGKAPCLVGVRGVEDHHILELPASYSAKAVVNLRLIRSIATSHWMVSKTHPLEEESHTYDLPKTVPGTPPGTRWSIYIHHPDTPPALFLDGAPVQDEREAPWQARLAHLTQLLEIKADSP